MENHEPIFRAFRPSDRESLTRHADNVKVWNNVRDYMPYPYTPEDADSFIAGCTARDPQTDFAIDVGGEAVGAIGIIPGSDVQRISAEVGYWLGEEYWGRGIMTRVLSVFADHIFSTTSVSHLSATVFGTNPASSRVLEKAGFRHVGVYRKAAVKNGLLVDLHCYEKLKPGV